MTTQAEKIDGLMARVTELENAAGDTDLHDHDEEYLRLDNTSYIDELVQDAVDVRLVNLLEHASLRLAANGTADELLTLLKDAVRAR